MRYNFNSGYGRLTAESKAIQPLSPNGKVFLVGASTTPNIGQVQEIFGSDPDGVIRYYTTVNAAVAVCTANAGDVIYVLPGHTESVTATSINLSVAGVSVVCLGRGKTNAPVFTYTATGSTITVSAANCSWSGGFFKPDTAIAVVTAFTIGAAKDFLLGNGVFEDVGASASFTSIVTTGSTANAADGLSIVGNYHLGLATSPAATISILGNTNRLYVADNHVDSAATNNIGHFITAAALVLLGARILRNTLIVVGATNATVGIFLTTSATTDTGIVAFNLVASLDTTTALIATAGSGLQYFENYLTGDADFSGALWPTVDNPA